MHPKPLRSHIMWSWIAGVVGLALLAGACSDSPEVDPVVQDPAQAENCPQLVDVAVAMLRDSGEPADDMPFEEYQALRGTLYADLGTVAVRADELGCANAASHVFRRALAELSAETPRRAVLILDAAIFDPFRDDAAIEEHREVSLFVADRQAAKQEIYAVAKSVASGYLNDGADPVDWVDIDSDFGVALWVRWDIEEDWTPGRDVDRTTGILVLADRGVIGRDVIPIPGTEPGAERWEWVEDIFINGIDLETLQLSIPYQTNNAVTDAQQEG